MSSRVIQVLLENNELDNIKTVYSSNTNILATIIARGDIVKIKKVAVSKNPGIYILYGKNDLNNNLIYIGESDKVGDRILRHSKDENKAFWEEVIIFTSNTETDTTISKSHIKYIENKLYLIAKESTTVELTESQNIPQRPKISRIEEALAEEFLDNLLFILKALRYDFFTPTTTTKILNDAMHRTNDLENNLIFNYSVNDASAKMRIISGNYVLLKGSTLSNSYRSSAALSIKKKRDDLIARKIIIINNLKLLTVMEDIPFTSASTAASMVCGGNSAGPQKWKLENGTTLKEYENRFETIDYGTF